MPVQEGQSLVEETNLAEHMEEDELAALAQEVIDNYDTDLRSREEWEEKHEMWLKLYHQSDEPENQPWHNSSTEGLPVFTEAVNQFQSRTYKAFFGNRYFVEAIPVGESTQESRERGDRIAAHMNFQLGDLDRTYKWNKNQMFMATALHGSDFTKTYFSHVKRRTVIERVRAVDLVVPYHTGPVRIEDLERKTQVKYMSINETRVLERMGFFVDEAEPYEGESDEDGGARSAAIQEQGLQQNAAYGFTDNKNALILEQHGLWDFDDDDIAEPYIVWVDMQSRKVLRIQIRYEIDEFGAPIEGKEPIEYFTHYQFMPNPDGFYGLGLGHLMGKINKALNKLVRLLIDSGELSTQGNNTFFLSENIGIKGDEFEVSLGRANKIPRNVEDIRRAIMQLQFPGPSPEVLNAIQILSDAAQRISSSSDVLAGQPDKVYQPMALLSMIEQGLQLYSSVQEFLGYSMEDELNKVYRLNAKYMQEEEYFTQNDKQLQVTPEDYRDDFKVRPIFDPNYSTRAQRLARAEATYNLILQNPLTAENPQSLYLATKQYLEAFDAENIDEMLPPPEIPQTIRLDDQTLENAYFLLPAEQRPIFDVFPDQDHLTHIELIDKFITQFLDGGQAMEVPDQEGGDPALSRMVQKMSNEQKQEVINNLLNHRQKHLGFHYGQVNGVMNEQGEPSQRSNGRMAGTPDDQTGVEEIMQLLSTVSGT